MRKLANPSKYNNVILTITKKRGFKFVCVWFNFANTTEQINLNEILLKIPDKPGSSTIQTNKPRINFFSDNDLLTPNGYKRIVKYKNKADLRKKGG